MPKKKSNNLLYLSLLFIALGLITLFAKTQYVPKPNDNNGLPRINIPTKNNCGVENCHGLDLKCGTNPVQVCDEMYQIGDGCRQFASCGISNGKCGVIESDKFKVCKSCVSECIRQHSNNPEFLSLCESDCIQGQPNLPD